MIPYGISDYKKIREGNYYYIDKTRFIEHIERQPPYLFLIRPRRFGKSLLVSMLETYYDRQYSTKFESFFKGTYIFDNPTKEKSSYYVWRLDFSRVDSKNPEEHFNEYINNSLNEFARKYALDIQFKSEHSNSNLNTLISHGQLNQLPFYIIVDEYDNFINELLVKDEASYKKLVTGQEAVFKQFFKTLKAGTSGADAPVKKLFVTGVSPLAMYDITSGFNIGTNITTDALFNDVLGVTREEAAAMFDLYGLADQQEAAFSRMDEWYDGYKFSRNVSHTIYNTDMVLYYVKSLIDTGTEPEELIDINVRSDYFKIRFLVQTDRKLNGNFSVLNGLLSTGSTAVSKLKDSFSAFDIRDRDNFVSLLFYLGLVTIEKYELGLLHLKIPNQTIRKIVGEFVQKAIEGNGLLHIGLDEFNLQVRELAFFRKMTVFGYLAQQIGEHSKIRDYISGESFIKGFLAAYFSLNPYYEVSTEKESGKGFVDIYLHPITPDVPYPAAIELKYIKRNELTDALLAEKTAEAVAQLQRYQLPDHAVRVVLVFHGWELVKVLDARTQE